MTENATTTRQPVLYLSHGAPPLADDPVWTQQLAGWSQDVARPANILMVSAHWEEAPLALSATSGDVPLLYDFWGFPRRYYEVTYDAPGAPALADSVTALLHSADTPVQRDETRGLDHGAYVPLVEMYPDADIPVLQMSMPTLDPQALFDLGRRLAPLRDEGTLIVGSGFTTHNLPLVQPRRRCRRTASHPLGRVRPLGGRGAGAQRCRLDPGLHEQGPGRARGPSQDRALGTAVRQSRRGIRVRKSGQQERDRRVLVRPEQAVLAVLLRG